MRRTHSAWYGLLPALLLFHPRLRVVALNLILGLHTSYRV